MPFVKLDCGIINSTIWLDRPAREIFITALLMAEPHEITEPTPQIAPNNLEETGWVIPAGWYGFVHASGPGLIDRAKVSQEEGKPALIRLGDPELESRSQEFEGRRLIRVNGGYVVLNFMKYRERDYSGAARQAKYRKRKAEKLSASRVTGITSRVIVTQAEAEAEVEAEAEDLSPRVDPVKEIREGDAGIRPSRARAETAVNGWTEPHANPHGNSELLVNGHDQRRHAQHAWCAEGRPSLCVTYALHSEVLGASQKSADEVKAWYVSTLAKFNGQPIGDDKFIFWRNELALWIGTVTGPPPKKKAPAFDMEAAIADARKTGLIR